MGVLFNRVDRCISFLKNGIDLGTAFADVPLDERLYPCIGLRTPDEEARCPAATNWRHRCLQGWRSSAPCLSAAQCQAGVHACSLVPRDTRGGVLPCCHDSDAG